MTPQQFKKTVWKHAHKQGRKLPWRGKNTTPYQIMVSEVMLQQTQVDRVVPKYRAFLKRFPSFSALADAPLKDVLEKWSGLGYNRRAKYLQEAAKIVVHDFGGRLPRDERSLVALPGIGTYTARALQTFAWNMPTVLIETNIRTVFLHHFFPRARKPVSDKQLVRYIVQTLHEKNSREWYAALMDYGTHLKKTLTENPSRKSKHHTTQSRFEGSHRQTRGAILKALTQADRGLSPKALTEKTGLPQKRIAPALRELKREGFVRGQRGHFVL